MCHVFFRLWYLVVQCRPRDCSSPALLTRTPAYSLSPRSCTEQQVSWPNVQLPPASWLSGPQSICLVCLLKANVLPLTRVRQDKQTVCLTANNVRSARPQVWSRLPKWPVKCWQCRAESPLPIPDWREHQCSGKHDSTWSQHGFGQLPCKTVSSKVVIISWRLEDNVWAH